MPTDLTVTIIQSDLVWHDPPANRDRFDTHIANIAQDTDLIVLPEMFTTGFTMVPSAVAESMDGPTMQWMHEKAKETQAAITGSIVIQENDYYYNRLIFMHPDGTYESYDKRHLFAMADEDQHYEQGKEILSVAYKGWTICPLICYDLRFPVWARNRPPHYDLLLYVANWPEKRSYDWRTLLQARAIENQSYVIGVNRVGKDHNDYIYNGDSCIIDPGWHKTLYHHEKTEAVHTMTLSYPHLQDVRAKLPFLRDMSGDVRVESRE